MSRSALHQYVSDKGPLTRNNPEVQRIAKATGFSADHVYQVVIGRRIPAQKCAIAIAAALKGRQGVQDSLVHLQDVVDG
jgi:hypothetical protein